MSSHIANISPYLARARARIALAEGVIINPSDDGRTATDPMLVPEPSPPRVAPTESSQLPSIWEALAIAIVGGIMVIAILRGVLGHF